MIKYFKFTILIMFFLQCKLPEQPNLDKKENDYFKILESKFNCKIKREISPDYLEGLTKKSEYLIELNELSCSFIDSADLKSESINIAKDIYGKILLNNSIYQTVTVVFSCSIGKDQYSSKSFDYNFKELQ